MKLNKYIACLLAGSIMASCNNFESIQIRIQRLRLQPLSWQPEPLWVL